MAQQVLMYQSERGKVYPTLHEAERDDWVSKVMKESEDLSGRDKNGAFQHLADWAARELLDWVYDNRIAEKK